MAVGGSATDMHRSTDLVQQSEEEAHTTMNVRRRAVMKTKMVQRENRTICALDKLKLAVLLPKPHYTLHIHGFHAVNTICVAGGRLKWLPVLPSVCLYNSVLPWFCMQSTAAASGAMTPC